jgi:hypothetical protein
VTAPTWPAIVARSLEMGTRAATVTAIRHLFAQADIAELKRGGEVEVRVVAVPNDFVPPKAGVFIKETMNALADLGEPWAQTLRVGGRRHHNAGALVCPDREHSEA